MNVQSLELTLTGSSDLVLLVELRTWFERAVALMKVQCWLEVGGDFIWPSDFGGVTGGETRLLLHFVGVEKLESSAGKVFRAIFPGEPSVLVPVVCSYS